jgi:hypothetical protein
MRTKLSFFTPLLVILVGFNIVLAADDDTTFPTHPNEGSDAAQSGEFLVEKPPSEKIASSTSESLTPHASSFMSETSAGGPSDAPGADADAEDNDEFYDKKKPAKIKISRDNKDKDDAAAPYQWWTKDTLGQDLNLMSSFTPS